MTRAEAGRLGGIKTKSVMKGIIEKKIQEYNLSPALCTYCRKPLDYSKRHNKFCNQSCAASYNNSMRIIKSAREKPCLNCGKLIPNKNKFCSGGCCSQYHSKIERTRVLEEWKRGTHCGYGINGQISPAIKKYMLKKSNYKCEVCGWGEKNPYTGRYTLEVHHKDGNYKNNTEENLMVLCPNCHSLTSTYKALNTGKGRECRRKE